MEQTGAEAGLSGDAQIRLALKAIIENGGHASMKDLYGAVEQAMHGSRLSAAGKASLRFFINRVAVKAGYVYPYDSANPGWRITPEGREAVLAPVAPVEEAVNVDTNEPVHELSNSARGAAFEHYTLAVLKQMYPIYTWYHQGHYKRLERGLDFLGTQTGYDDRKPHTIGVQVKFHAANSAPSQLEWFKFLAGCFARQVNLAIFITSGRLTSEQRREAGEARVVVIEGVAEVTRIAALYGQPPFDLFDDHQVEERELP